jgi:hypothetical protein
MMRARGIKPEWEVFSPTHLIQDVATLIEEGLDEDPPFVNIVLNVHRGFQGAMPYSPRVLQSMVDLLPKGAVFCVSGIGPAQLPAAMNALLLGGMSASGSRTICTTARASSRPTSSSPSGSSAWCGRWGSSRRRRPRRVRCSAFPSGEPRCGRASRPARHEPRGDAAQVCGRGIPIRQAQEFAAGSRRRAFDRGR